MTRLHLNFTVHTVLPNLVTYYYIGIGTYIIIYGCMVYGNSRHRRNIKLNKRDVMIYEFRDYYKKCFQKVYMYIIKRHTRFKYDFKL